MFLSSKHTVCQEKKVPKIWIMAVENLEQLLQNSSNIKKKNRLCNDLTSWRTEGIIYKGWFFIGNNSNPVEIMGRSKELHQNDKYAILKYDKILTRKFCK